MTNSELIQEVIEHNEEKLAVCKKELERINNPQIYGACLCRCNCIVINKERMMTVTTKDNHTTYEFNPLYPTFFSAEMANKIVREDIYKDIHGNRIKMEIIGEKEYYMMLQEKAEKAIELFKTLKN